MRRLIGAAAVCAAALVAGCSWFVTTDPPKVDEATRLQERYGAILARLTPEERAQFDTLETDGGRDAYLDEIGASAEARIHILLREGLLTEEVERQLGPPEDRETEWSGGSAYEYWTYREPVRRFVEVKSILQFRDDTLIGWRVIRKNGN